ncbi:hypothetical protein V2P24_02075 [Mycoplasma putrefaciens]|uniref:MSC_0621 family F1-like ATPase epsilon subunit n=1 Tax=Mycoplasma putrefaciens TaxID=2123 RepID=UPI003DA1D22A
MNLNSSFNLTINFIESKKTLNFDRVAVAFNIDEQEDWMELANDFLVGYQMLLLKIYHYKTRQYKYLFCKNTHILVSKNTITVNTFSDAEFYTQNFVKKQNDQLLKKVNKKINSLLAMQKIGLDLEKLIELKQLQEQQYQLKMIKELSLRKENYEEI